MGRPAVIKAGTILPLGHATPASFELGDIMAEVRAVTETAQAEAARIVADARSQADAIRRQAHAEGHRAGHEKGLAEGRAAGKAEALASARQAFAEQQRSLIAAYQQVIGQINDMRAAWEASARQDLIDLAMAIARRVARHVGQRDRQAVLGNMDEAIRLVGARSEVTIHVNPADAETARQFASSLVAQQEQWQHVGVVQTAEVSPGGCRIQWGTGGVDAGIETQLDRIEAELGSGSSAEAARADAEAAQANTEAAQASVEAAQAALRGDAPDGATEK